MHAVATQIIKNIREANLDQLPSALDRLAREARYQNNPEIGDCVLDIIQGAYLALDLRKADRLEKTAQRLETVIEKVVPFGRRRIA